MSARDLIRAQQSFEFVPFPVESIGPADALGINLALEPNEFGINFGDPIGDGVTFVLVHAFRPKAPCLESAKCEISTALSKRQTVSLTAAASLAITCATTKFAILGSRGRMLTA
jgi:hypothetical protein